MPMLNLKSKIKDRILITLPLHILSIVDGLFAICSLTLIETDLAPRFADAVASHRINHAYEEWNDEMAPHGLGMPLGGGAAFVEMFDAAARAIIGDSYVVLDFGTFGVDDIVESQGTEVVGEIPTFESPAPIVPVTPT